MSNKQLHLLFTGKIFIDALTIMRGSTIWWCLQFRMWFAAKPEHILKKFRSPLANVQLWKDVTHFTCYYRHCKHKFCCENNCLNQHTLTKTICCCCRPSRLIHVFCCWYTKKVSDHQVACVAKPFMAAVPSNSDEVQVQHATGIR